MQKTYIVNRAVKFNIQNLEDQGVQDFLEFHFNCLKGIRLHMTNLINSGSIDITKSSKKYIYVNDSEGQKTHCSMIKDNILGFGELVKNLDMEHCQVKYTRGLIQYVSDRIISFTNRNRRDIQKGTKKISFPAIKRKDIQLKNQIVDLDFKNNTLNLIVFKNTDPQGRFPKLIFDPDNSFLSHKNGLGSSKCKLFGGNLILKRHVFVACTSEEKSFSYKPVGSIGMDINKTSESFITFSQPINGKSIFTKPEEIINIEEELKKLNNKLSSRFKKGRKVLKTGERPFNSKVARPLRKKVEKLHTTHTNLINSFLREVGIIDFVKDNNLLLCLDGVKCGQNLGTFGQDKINPFLIKECENKSIPFILPPTKNTSRRCAVCNHINKKNRATQSNFQCVQCGHKDHADKNAAKNTARTGLFLYNELENNDTKSAVMIKMIEGHFKELNPPPENTNTTTKVPKLGKKYLKVSTKAKVKKTSQPQMTLDFS